MIDCAIFDKSTKIGSKVFDILQAKLEMEPSAPWSLRGPHPCQI